MSDSPTRTVVHLFSDIEGSTQLWERHPEAMPSVIQRHDQLVDELIERHGGRVVDHAGDGVFAVFEDGTPLECALAIQQAIQLESWAGIEELRVRMGLHAGEVGPEQIDDRGPLANRTARIMDAGHGGQILVTPEVLEHCKVPEGADVEDLGSHELKDLTEPQPIRQLTHPDLELREFPALRTLSTHPHNLPTQTTPFVGREAELAVLTDRLSEDESRLVTVLGPGGMGKTRLAIQAAAEQAETFPDGVFFVSLASLESEASAVYAIADAIGFTFYSSEDPQTQLIRYLEGKAVLLVLDNCEHLPMGELVSELRQGVPELTVLTTSQTRLNLKSEVVLDLQGLAVPAETPSLDEVDEHSGLRLFVESAQRARSDFTVDEQDLTHMVHACQLLEGMPLGIELAAAWARVLPIEEIVDEIEANLDFLAGAGEDRPRRQRSLRAVFNHSWELLSEDERDVMERLAVFRGPFGRIEAKQVAGAGLMILAGLVDSSLLQVPEPGRYAIHNLLRHYAAEQLAHDPEQYRQTHRDHAAYFADLMAHWEPELRGERQIEALDAIQEAFDDVRLMWETALDEREWGWIERSVHALYEFGHQRSRYQEGQPLLQAALNAIERESTDADVSRLKAILLVRLGTFQRELGQTDSARQALREGLSLTRQYGDGAETAFALHRLGHTLLSSDLETAWSLHEEAKTIRQEIGDNPGLAISLIELGHVKMNQGELEESKRLYEKALTILRNTEHKPYLAIGLSNLGTIELHQGNKDRCRQLYAEALDMLHDIGDKQGEAKLRTNLGLLEWKAEHLSQSREFLEESLRIGRDIGYKSGVAMNLLNLGLIERDQGDLQASRARHAQSLAIHRDIDNKPGMALSLLNLGLVEWAQGNLEASRSRLEESLAIYHEVGDKRSIAFTLCGFMPILHHEGRSMDAAQLQGTATSLLEQAGAAMDPDVQTLYDDATENLRTTLSEDDYRQAFEAGQEMSLEEAIEIATGTETPE